MFCYEQKQYSRLFYHLKFVVNFLFSFRILCTVNKVHVCVGGNSLIKRKLENKFDTDTVEKVKWSVIIHIFHINILNLNMRREREGVTERFPSCCICFGILPHSKWPHSIISILFLNVFCQFDLNIRQKKLINHKPDWIMEQKFWSTLRGYYYHIVSLMFWFP